MTQAERPHPIPKGRYAAIKTEWELTESSGGDPMVVHQFVLTEEAGEYAGKKLRHSNMLTNTGLPFWERTMVALGVDPGDLADNDDVDVEEVETSTVGQPCILVVEVDEKFDPSMPRNNVRSVLPPA